MTYTSQPGEMKAAALALAGRGLKVFPLTPRSKEPLGGSNGHLQATDDLDKVERMWRDVTFANVGVAAAASGLYMVDVDTDPVKGKVGGQTWARICAEHGFVDTYTVRSWSGGLHFWYRMPEGMALRNTTGKGKDGRGIGPDVDTRGNGYVIAPPSIVREKDRIGQYVLEKDAPFMWLPEHLVEMCRDRERPERPEGAPVAGDSEVLARLESLAGQLEEAPDGQGTPTASRIAFWCGQYVGAGQLDEDQVVGRLLDAVSGWTWRSDGDFRAMSHQIIKGVADGAANPRPWERPISPQPAASAAPALEGDLMVTPQDLDAPEGLQGPDVVDPEKEAARELSDWASDVGQAHHLFERLPVRLRHADGVGWMSWDGARWKVVNDDYVGNRAVTFYRKQFKAMLLKYAATEEKRFEVLAKAYKSFMSASKISSIIRVMRMIDGVYTDVADLDRDLDLLNTPNGIVDLRTGRLSPHDPDRLMTKVTSGRFRPGYRHPDWTKGLTALPPEQADYMQIRLGQAATGHNAKDAIFMVGTGNNGKSLYSTEGVFPALGDYAHMAQPTLISKGQGTGATPDRASLRGVRFALIEELPESHALSVEEIKRIADTAIITARLLHSNPITFRATHSLFVTSNSKPSVSEVDHGTWRRLVLVDFPYTFKEKAEGPNDREGDPTLKRRVMDGETGQHDAIVTWLVEGAMRYFADPMLVEIERRPLAVVEAVAGWQMEADRIMAYFTDRLEIDADSMVWRQDLFEDFTAFLKEQQHATWSSETFLGRFRIHEMVRRAGVTEGQVRTSASKISRPPAPPGTTWSSTVKPLPSRVRVMRGLRFRRDEPEATES